MVVSCVAGQPRPNVLDGGPVNESMLFADKHSYAVTLRNVFYGGDGVTALPWSQCEVFAPIGPVTMVDGLREPLEY